MSQTTLLATKACNEAKKARIGHSPKRDEDTFRRVERTLNDVAIDVGALIDAVCCRCGDWVDWQHYRPLPGIRPNGSAASDYIIRLALLDDIFGLRSGGYMEMRASLEGRIIEIYGGYYDAYDEPEPVIDGSLRWDEVSHQRLGQVLLWMYDRIIQAHMAREMSEDTLVCLPAASWAMSTVQATRDLDGGACLKAVGIR
ncbi:MAG: hypothetical protein QUS33_06090 [Dehalococcoidia bacterium]|nr:hypothetical protein [Dehalococcoidia bacterium]